MLSKKRMISIALVVALNATTLNAVSSIGSAFETVDSDGGSWTDNNSGMTYTSYGKSEFKFKKRVTTFTPWFKGRAPSVKAGCGGISLDAGFTGFLDLEEIGKQLEEAMKSVGMGVIVVLVQTLPSIGKAFENIQKLVRKMQQMLQNACQLTVSALSENEDLKKFKSDAQSEVNNVIDPINSAFGGAEDFLDELMTETKCSSGDANCEANKKKQVENAVGANDNKCFLGDRNFCNAVTSYKDGKSYFAKTTLENLVKDGKIGNDSIQVTAEDRTMMMLKIAIFGLLYEKKENSFARFLEVDSEPFYKVEESKRKEILERSNNEMHPIAAIDLEWSQPENTVAEVVKFFTGTSTTQKLKIAKNYEMLLTKTCEKTSKNGGCEGTYQVDARFVDKEVSSVEYFELEWQGLYVNTLKTLLSKVNKANNPTPTNPVGLYVPGGEQWLEDILSAYNKNSMFNYKYYVELLAKANVVFAIKELINQVEEESQSIEANKASSWIVERYRTVVKDRSKKLSNKIKYDFTPDVQYLNNIEERFKFLRKHKVWQNKIK